ncbi:DUF447 domain-containing protein [Haloquadratum walsbyi]|jgi:Uncharacterized conserved protein|uniref:DUF447 family protein n=1 Tax=Haloquadratum walsbyi J07HQW2 TaxID=1238425 RepID=U1PSA0_9EURY|nr:DUF447 domain-containing protein [Haloquadratum walsbyi]ERG95251.1 MAG: hypothetical protein J07HQW2_01702 [Haloquadratum walsbyi J07HQW2]
MTDTSTAWPVGLRGVTESIVTTHGPNDRWNAAALGLHAPDPHPGQKSDHTSDNKNVDSTQDSSKSYDSGTTAVKTSTEAKSGAESTNRSIITATTWGNTRTRRNFHREGGGVIQFVSDPRAFVAAATTIYEVDEPVLDTAHAWAEVTAERLEQGERGGTQWEQWAIQPVETGVIDRTVPTINRGFAAVIDATVAASRLNVASYDTDTLLDRLRYFAETVDRCGGPREQAAFAQLDSVTEWRSQVDEPEAIPVFDE